MNPPITTSMIGWMMAVVLQNTVGRKCSLSTDGPGEMFNLDLDIDIKASDLALAVDAFTAAVLAPIADQMIKEARRPGMDFVFLREHQALKREGFETVCAYAYDDNLGTSVYLMRDGEHFRFSLRYWLKERPPYKVAYKVVPDVPPEDWELEERGLQRIIADDIAIGKAEIVKP